MSPPEDFCLHSQAINFSFFLLPDFYMQVWASEWPWKEGRPTTCRGIQRSGGEHPWRPWLSSRHLGPASMVKSSWFLRPLSLLQRWWKDLEEFQQVCPLDWFHLVPVFLERVEPQIQMQDFQYSWTKCSQCMRRLDAQQVSRKRPLCLRGCALPMDLSCRTWHRAGEPSHFWYLPQELLQDQQDHQQV